MYRKILVRSNDRDSSSTGSHNFTVALPDVVKEGKYKLSSAQMYNTAYTITTGVNDKVYCSLGNKQLTAGYYATSTAFASQVQTDLQTVDSNFTVTYSTTTCKFTIANSVSAFILQWASSTGDDCSDQLGFALSNTTSGLTVTSTFIPVLPQSVAVLIQIGEAQSTDYYLTTNANSNLLGSLRVPIDVGFGSVVNFVPEANHEQYINLRGTKRLTVKLYDEQGRIFNLNGTDWTMELEQCYDRCSDD